MWGIKEGELAENGLVFIVSLQTKPSGTVRRGDAYDQRVKHTLPDEWSSKCRNVSAKSVGIHKSIQ